MKTKLVFLAAGIWLAATIAGLSQLPTLTRLTTGDIADDRGEFIGAAWGDFNNDGSNWFAIGTRCLCEP